MNRFPSISHFLADFRVYQQRNCLENDIDLDCPLWTKLLVTTLQHDYPDRVSEWIDMAPSTLLPILDRIAKSHPQQSTRPFTRPAHRTQEQSSARGSSLALSPTSHSSDQNSHRYKPSVQRSNPGVHTDQLPNPENTVLTAMLDSGADLYIVNDKANFLSYSSSTQPITDIGGTVVHAVGYGNVELCTEYGTLQLQNVYRIPSSHNLISTHQLGKSGFTVIWKSHTRPVEVLDSQGRVVLCFSHEGCRLVTPMRLDYQPPGSSNFIQNTRAEPSPWHCRLAHINRQYAARAL